METDYISRADAVRALMERYHYDESSVAALYSIPAADVRPVVLCRDCKWFNPANSDWCCEFENGLICPCEDDFCSFGERRDGGADG